MKRSFDLTGLLLLATVPLLSQASGSPDAAKIGELLRFTMKESPAEVVRLMGRPERVDNSSPASPGNTKVQLTKTTTTTAPRVGSSACVPAIANC